MKNQKIVAILFIILGISFAFYWFQYRPVKIRQDCSWITIHQDAVPAKPAMTEEELKAKNMLEEECKSNIVERERNPYIFDFCKDRPERNKEIISQYKNPQPEIAAKDWFEKATEKEYQFCIRSKGVIK